MAELLQIQFAEHGALIDGGVGIHEILEVLVAQLTTSDTLKERLNDRYREAPVESQMSEMMGWQILGHSLCRALRKCTTLECFK